MNQQQNCDSDSDSDNSDRIDIADGLSSDTLSALLAFMNPPSMELGEVDVDNLDSLPIPPSDSSGGKISEKSVVAAFTPKDVNVIAETFARLQARADAEELENPMEDVKAAIEDRVLLVLDHSAPEDGITTLLNDGVVRLNGILSAETCDACRSSILSELQVKIDQDDEMTVETGFGDVLTRQNRWDLYLRRQGPYATALQECFGSRASKLSAFFEELFEGKDASFHEFSALVSDKDAKSQPIHPDTWFQRDCPLYTVFIALQDIEASMGPTLFLPNTNNEHDHAQHKNPKLKDKLLARSVYKQGLLQKGDLVIMDSRTLHCGTGNSSGKRVLLYFTLRNPHFQETPPPSGSKFADLNFSLGELLQEES